MKKVASTLKQIHGSEIYQRILDPKDPLDDVIEEVMGWWKMDLYGRKPSPALVDENGELLKPTDLDMSCFLAALVDRGAVICLPKYTIRRPRQLREDEWIVSADNRHGKLHGLTANKSVFSFSVRMFDANVVKKSDEGDSVGAFRNFMVVDLDGHFYDGWKVIEFAPSRKENSFLEEKGLWTENKVFFDRFVHPNRWVSFYGQPYILTKILTARLEAEAKDLYQQVKAQTQFAPVADEEERESPAIASGPATTEQVKAFEASVDAPIPTAGFAQLPADKASERLKKLRFADVPALRFATRATELAFCQRAHSFDSFESEVYNEPLPAWISGATWGNHREKRTDWRRLVLDQPVPFARGLALRYRVRWKGERVAG